MSIARKVLSNTIVQVAGKVGTSIVGIISVKLLTNYLGTSGYGEYSQVYQFLALFGIMADLGLFTIAVREMSRDEKSIPYVMGNILTIRITVAFLAMLLAVIMAYSLPRYQATYVPLGVAIASIGVFLAIVTSTVSSVLQVYLKMTRATLALVAGRFVGFVYLIAAVFIFKNDPARGWSHLMLAGVWGGIVMTGLTVFYGRQLTSLHLRFDKSFWRNVIVKSLPYGLALVFNMIYFQINSIFLFQMKGSAENGIFSVPSKIMEILTVVAIYFMNSVLPTLTKHINNKSDPESGKKVRQIIQYSFDFMSMAGLPIVAGGLVLAYPLTFAISSPEFLSRISEGFYGADVSLQILLFALFFSYLSTVLGFVLIALSRQNYLLFTAIGGVILSVGLNLWLIPDFGARGAAFTSAVSEFMIFLALYFITHRFIDYTINLKSSAKCLLSAVVMGVFLSLLRDPAYRLVGGVSLFGLIPLGGLIYFGMLFLTGALSRDLLKMLKT